MNNNKIVFKASVVAIPFGVTHIYNGAKLASRSPVPTGQGKEFCGIKCTNKDPIYYTFGAGQKTTSAMALMDW